MADSFGITEFNNNVNSTFTGYNNTGSLLFNTNLFMYAVSSVLYISNNENSTFETVESTLQSKNGSNTKINAALSRLSLESNENTKVRGELNNLDFLNNTDARFFGTQNAGSFEKNRKINYSGNNGNFTFFGNENTKIFGRNNFITALNNTNLNIEGDNHQLIISGTVNHEIKTVPENSSENIVTVQLQSNQEKDFFVTYFIDYTNEAKIEFNKYSLGIFKFNLTEIGDQIEVNFDLLELDAGSYELIYSSSTKYTIRATKYENTQTLSMNGHSVTVPNFADANVIFIRPIGNLASV